MNVVTKCGINNMEKKIKEIIENRLGINPANYKEESSFIMDLGCDSLDLVDIIMEVEKEFNISIPDDAIDQVSTVGGLINYVKERAK